MATALMRSYPWNINMVAGRSFISAPVFTRNDFPGKISESRNTVPLVFQAFNKQTTILKDMTYNELEAWVVSLGNKKGRAAVLWKWLYGNGRWAQSVDDMEGISEEFRTMLKENVEFGALSLDHIYNADDGTRKIIFSLGEVGSVETVVIPCAGGRTTVCVSSQVGCAMNCQFCFTGRMGLRQHLSTAQIVEQVVVACRLFSKELGPITNVVFMGMGEPLHNFENVIRAANIMVDDHGLHLSPHKVCVSTSGLVPELRRFLRESVCVLAVSLNATTDEVRDWIMPINRKYNLGMLLTALKEELEQRKKSHVFFEYILLSGVNDSLEDAMRLVSLVNGIPCKINLLSFNPHKGSIFLPSSEERMSAFREVLVNAGLLVFIRKSRGDDQMAACGQLGNLGADGAPPRLRLSKSAMIKLN